MTSTQLSALLMELLALPQETEWVEWKHNNDHPEMIAQRLSALANSAALHGRDTGSSLRTGCQIPACRRIRPVIRRSPPCFQLSAEEPS